MLLLALVYGPKFKPVLIVSCFSMSLASCDLSRELNENTLAISTTVSQIHNQQILENLQVFIDDPYAIPAQVVLSGGGVQVTNSVTPSFSNFLQPWKAANGSYTNAYTQNWSVTPVNDPDDVRRLRALYRLAVYGNNGDRLESYDARSKIWKENVTSLKFAKASRSALFDLEYPRILITDSSIQTGVSSGETIAKGKKSETTGANRSVSSMLVQPDEACNQEYPNVSCPTNPFYFPRTSPLDPSQPREGRFGTDRNMLTALGSMLAVPHQWLFWSAGPIGAPSLPYQPPNPNGCAVIWPHYISTTRFSHTLYTCANDEVDAWRKFDDFALWVWAATPNTSGGGSSSAGGGSGTGGTGGGKSKGSASTVLTSPAGGH